MFRKFTLSLLLTVSAFAVSKFSFAITYVDNGTSNTYDLTASDSLFVATGTFTGTISSFPFGSKSTISDLATFAPTNFPNTNGNSARGTMYNYGAIIFNATFLSNTNFTLHNYGMITFGSTTTLRGNGQTWTNYYGGIITFTGDVVMNGQAGDNNNFMINYDSVYFGGNFQMNSGSGFTNYKDFVGAGNLTLNGGTFNNEGNLVITGEIDMNSGTSVIRNYCRIETSGGIDNSNGNFYNYSYVWAKNSDIRNTANIINSSIANNTSVPAVTTPMIHGRSYFHSTGGTMTGPALLYFYGTTSITGGTIGVPGVTTDTIKMYDVTRTQPTQIMDVQSGGIRYPNYIYNAWGVPDSNKVYLLGCSIEIILESPLPIKWNYFLVNLFNNVPVLTWSAEYERGTTFEIQRSYNGSSFHGLKDVPSDFGRSEYKYDDLLVNNQVPVVFYRIKATQLNGEVKYSPTRIVRFNSKKGVFINTVPNPFTNSFIINYNAVEKETITVRMFNVSGQQKLAKAFIVNSGNNSINITEAAKLANGLYVIQVSNGDNIISTSKIIKQ